MFGQSTEEALLSRLDANDTERFAKQIIRQLPGKNPGMNLQRSRDRCWLRPRAKFRGWKNL